MTTVGSIDESWGGRKREVVAASFLGWMLDAFDFFLLVFVLRRLAGDFHTGVEAITWAMQATLKSQRFMVNALLSPGRYDRHRR